MFFEKVLSFNGAWEKVNSNYSKELDDIKLALPEFINSYIIEKKKSKKLRLTSREIWEKVLGKKNWQPINKAIYTEADKRIKIDSLGPVKNEICVSIPLSHLEFFNRWFFLHSTIAVKYGIIGIPILLIPTSKYTSLIEEKWLKRTNFETVQNQLEALAPLSHPSPFLIIGFTEQSNINGTEIIELESDPLVNIGKRIFKWESEFPPQFHQAGLEILNFFGTYLREQYPEENAEITIRQMGLNLRMVVESEDSKPYIIEKAFGEYSSIVSGLVSPKEYISNNDLILKLETQLDFSKLQIKLNQKIIDKQEKDIERLFNMLNKETIINNSINIENHIELNISNDILNAIDLVNELISLTSKSSEEYFNLKELERALKTIKDEPNKNMVRNSAAMKKFNKIIGIINNKHSKLSKIINNVQTGWELFKNLAKTYNKIADWCGLPHVPSVFL